MRSIPTVMILSACCAWLAACGGDFEPAARITKLRLLALRADAPFAQPGQTVTLQPLTAAREPEALSWAFATCTDPASGTVDGCLSELDGPFTEFELAAGGLQVQVGEREQYRRTRALGVAIAACPGTIEEGETGQVPLRCRDAAGEPLPLDRFEVGVKRIFVRERDQNENPSIEVLRWEGEPWAEDDIPEVEACEKDTDEIEDCPKSLRHSLGIETSAPESGVDESGLAFREQQIVQVYATQGVFDFEVRLAEDADNSWAAQAWANQDLATLWFVVRDDRGGVGWATRQVRVR